MSQISIKDAKITKSPKREKIIISHDSLGYLTHRYHFKQEGVNGMNDDEPSQKKILSIVKNIKIPSLLMYYMNKILLLKLQM